MPTKPLDRLMFAQGGLCFFCNASLSKADASVEHLVASSRAGSNSDDNCVACCKALNTLLGSMSLKEKIKVVMNQKGQFKCPNGAGNPKSTPKLLSKTAAAKAAPGGISSETIATVVANLKSCSNNRPRTLKTLTSSIKALTNLKLTDKQVESLIEHLISIGKIAVSDNKLAYKL